MTVAVVDASIVIKWVIDEDGSHDAVALRQQANLIAPDLLVAECANILWEKTRRAEISTEEALFSARLLQSAEIELFPMRPLFEAATRLAMELDHPAYDCLYLALAVREGCRLVTADDHFLRKLDQDKRAKFRDKAISLKAAARKGL